MLDLNNKIYCNKNLEEGDYVHFMTKSIEQQDVVNLNINNFDNKFNKISKEIRF